MSATTSDLTKQTSGSNSVPAWISSGVLGLALGAGGMYLGLRIYHENPEGNAANPKQAATGAPAGAPMMGAGGMGMGGGGMGMGGGGMGMGGGGMGGGMGGGGAAGKRNLTALVGKLELLSRTDLKLQVELDAEQAKKVAAKLQELDKAEKLTAEEAQTHLDALEALLTEEQKKTLGLVSLPFGRGGPGAGGGGRGAAGRPGGGGAAGRPGGAGTAPVAAGGPPAAGAPPMMGMGGGMGGGGPAPDENPFSQDANQKRLRDLLARLAPGSPATPEPAKPDAAKPAAEKPAEEKTAEEKQKATKE